MHGLDQLFVKVWIGQFVALAWRGMLKAMHISKSFKIVVSAIYAFWSNEIKPSWRNNCESKESSHVICLIFNTTKPMNHKETKFFPGQKPRKESGTETPLTQPAEGTSFLNCSLEMLRWKSNLRGVEVDPSHTHTIPIQVTYILCYLYIYTVYTLYVNVCRCICICICICICMCIYVYV